MDLIISNQTIRQHNGLFSLNDLHKASGGVDKHRPAFFLRNQQTKELIAEIEQSSNCANLHSSKINQIAVATIEGKKGGTYACKELVYAYAMWISAKFHLFVIRAFDSLTQSQFIPAIAEQRHTISVEQQAQIRQAVAKRCKNSSTHYQTVYTAIGKHFNIPRYSELLASDFDSAMAFIESFSFTPAENQALYEVLADNAMHLRDYLKMLKVLKGLPIVSDSMGRNTFEQAANSYNAIIALANQLGLTNRYNQPMFGHNCINFYHGNALITR